MVSRPEMFEQTRAGLIAAATKLFVTRSYDTTSVSDIATAAGVTKGAFYHHFASKEDLLLTTQEQALDQVIARSEEVFAQNLPAAEELTALVCIQMQVLATYRNGLIISVTERRSLEPEKWSLIRSKRDRIESMIVGCITRGQKSGQFRSRGDPMLLAYGILGMCYWSNIWFRPDRGGWSLEDVGAEFARLALDGLMGPALSLSSVGTEANRSDKAAPTGRGHGQV